MPATAQNAVEPTTRIAESRETTLEKQLFEVRNLAEELLFYIERAEREGVGSLNSYTVLMAKKRAQKLKIGVM